MDAMSHGGATRNVALKLQQNIFAGFPISTSRLLGDHKLIWEVNRHQHLVLLAQAYVITGRDEYFDAVVRQLEHWWAENPFQRGINWASALEVGFRALSWIWIWHLLGVKMPADFRQRFLAELYRHGLHLEYNLSIYFSPNTHLLGEAVALHALGRLFPSFPRAALAQVGTRDRPRPHEHLRKAGWQLLRAVHLLPHLRARHVRVSCRAGRRSRIVSRRLASMAEFLASIMSDSGDLPFLGDDDGGRFFSPYGMRSRFARATLATASLLLGKVILSLHAARHRKRSLLVAWAGALSKSSAGDVLEHSLPPVSGQRNRRHAPRCSVRFV